MKFGSSWTIEEVIECLESGPRWASSAYSNLGKERYGEKVAIPHGSEEALQKIGSFGWGAGSDSLPGSGQAWVVVKPEGGYENPAQFAERVIDGSGLRGQMMMTVEVSIASP